MKGCFSDNILSFQTVQANDEMSRPVAFHVGVHYSQKNHSSFRSYILIGVARAKLSAGQGFKSNTILLVTSINLDSTCEPNIYVS